MNHLFCNLCGKTFRTAIAEAKHRHNAPILCNTRSRFWLARVKAEASGRK